MTRIISNFLIILTIFFSTMTKAENLIPREVLFGNPDKISTRLSPDGKHISYVAPLNGILNIWVAPTEDISQAKPITEDKDRGIWSYSWAYDNKHIIYSQDTAGDENTLLYSININNNKTVLLTPKNGIKSFISNISLDSPNEVLIAHNKLDPQYFDLYKVQIDTGESKLAYHNKKQYLQLTTNDSFEPVIGQKMLPTGEVEIYNLTKENDKLIHTIKTEDMLNTHISHISKDGKNYYMVDSEGRDNSALLKIDLKTDKKEELYYNAEEDISSLLVDQQTYEIQAVSTTHQRTKWHALNAGTAKDFAVLKTVEDGDLSIVSRTQDESKWIVSYIKSNAPHHYYLYERDNRQIRFLFTSNSKQDQFTFAKTHPIMIKARDGLQLPTYLTVPAWMDTQGNGTVKEPVPLVLYVHGGPNARDHWGFNATAQWLANRGYAVLQVNYRGSTGFGKKFINAGDGEWAGKMQRDLEDGVQWCIDQGITTRDKVVIMGGSYGGYATLVGMTMTPDLYAAGIDIVGISNLITFQKSIPPYWKPAKAHMMKMLGTDIETPEGVELLKQKSPTTHVSNIKKPLFIVQGSNDPRVVKAESDQIAERMKALNIPYVYLLYPDEGHGLAKPKNKLSMFAYIESFLGTVIGGKIEPHNNQFPGSSVEIQDGSQHEWIQDK